jgi:tRNA threonylcarbamoyladenosine modification (KEOPS) complex  Pcc1 subunit
MDLTLRTEEPYEELKQLFATELTRSHERSEITLENDRGNAVFTITAKDVTALRAATNTVTSVLGIWEKTKTVTHHG